ncbi:23 kDa integral membrane protein [Drosophila albomicans]|uniref:23 kDa integral membrane protein n=1 Tax=Drosophila albomicans TaxID=7291 RepID=A0A6P8WS23_DROAB|nr:23 kDa integral membrane protein [Drosophila albomicans]
MGCTSGCFKCFLNILNTLFALFGLLIIGIATLSLQQAPTVYITYLYVVGGIVFVASIIGCCGVCQESVCMTTTYGFILLALLVVQLLGLFGKNFDEDYIKQFAVADVDAKWNLEVIKPGAMDKIQRTYECCGRNGPDDYVIIQRTNLPLSCYPEGNTNVPYYTTGCVTAAADVFLRYFNYVNTSKWGSFGITALLCFCSFYLARRFRKERQTYSYHY